VVGDGVGDFDEASPAEDLDFDAFPVRYGHVFKDGVLLPPVEEVAVARDAAVSAHVARIEQPGNG
jgi:hypothetical protein